jgi:hypothetical protein
MSGSSPIGTWRLVAYKRTFSDTGELVDMMGPDPQGVITFGADGRMSAVITASGRSAEMSPAQLYANLMAYAGRFTITGDRLDTDVDVAWHPSWLGSRQTRYFAFHDDELHITTAEQTHPSFPGRLGRGVLIWRRDGA